MHSFSAIGSIVLNYHLALETPAIDCVFVVAIADVSRLTDSNGAHKEPLPPCKNSPEYSRLDMRQVSQTLAELTLAFPRSRGVRDYAYRRFTCGIAPDPDSAR